MAHFYNRTKIHQYLHNFGWNMAFNTYFNSAEQFVLSIVQYRPWWSAFWVTFQSLENTHNKSNNIQNVILQLHRKEFCTVQELYQDLNDPKMGGRRSAIEFYFAALPIKSSNNTATLLGSLPQYDTKLSQRSGHI